MNLLKSLYKLLFPKKVREKVFNATHTKPVIALNMSNAESISKAKITINKWVTTFNDKSLPHVFKLQERIERKKILKIPKPDLSNSWTKRRKIIGGGSNTYGINSGGKLPDNSMRTGGGGIILKNESCTTFDGKKYIAFLNGDIRFKSREYTDNRLFNRLKEYKARRVKPKGFGAHAVLFRDDRKLANYVNTLHKYTESSRCTATINTRFSFSKKSRLHKQSTPTLSNSKQRRPQTSSSVLSLQSRSSKNLSNSRYYKAQGKEETDDALIADVKSIVDSIGGIYRQKAPLQIFIPRSC